MTLLFIDNLGSSARHCRNMESDFVLASPEEGIDSHVQRGKCTTNVITARNEAELHAGRGAAVRFATSPRNEAPQLPIRPNGMGNAKAISLTYQASRALPP